MAGAILEDCFCFLYNEKVKKLIDKITCPRGIGGIAMLEDVLIRWGGYEVGAMEVYTDIFKLGTNQIQRNGEKSGEFKANPSGYWKNGDSKGH